VRSVLSHMPAGSEPPRGRRLPTRPDSLPAAVPRPIVWGPAAPGRAAPPPAHDSVVCVEMPALAVSRAHGQLRGEGLDGFYREGVRTLSRLEVRLGGVEPVPLQGVSVSAAEARFMGVLRVAGDPEPDPGVTVERLRHAEGRERITVRNSGGRPARLPFEIVLGTDLAALSAVAGGGRAADLLPRVHAAGLRWAAPARALAAKISARPSPHAVLASAGVLRWDLELQPGARWTVELTTELEQKTEPAVRGRGSAAVPWSVPAVRCDDARLTALVARSLDELRGLLLTDADHPNDAYLVSGAPWRPGLIPADALWAARMLLPLGTAPAAGTLRALVRRLRAGPGGVGAVLPGPMRHSGPGHPPACTATEATLLFVTVLAEAWRWGMPEAEVASLLPSAEAALEWLREQTECGAGRQMPDVFLVDVISGAGISAPTSGVPQAPRRRTLRTPIGTASETGRVPTATAPSTPRRALARPESAASARHQALRAVTQAHAHRAALHGAELLAAFGRPGAERWHEWAAGLRESFRERFWIDGLGGGCAAPALMPDGRPVPASGSELAHLLDTGLSAEGAMLPGLLEPDRARTLARRLAAPDLDTGWGLRSLTAKSPRFNPLGHRSGAVRVHETALAVAGLAEAGLEREAAALFRGLLDAVAHLGGAVPEMYGGEQRQPGAPGPLPHPAACRPAAVAAAAMVHLSAVVLAGARPDVPGRRVVVRPMSTAPLGELELAGLRVAERPFSVRISRIGVAVVEEAADALQLGSG
jgi:hypothetical protein